MSKARHGSDAGDSSIEKPSNSPPADNRRASAKRLRPFLLFAIIAGVIGLLAGIEVYRLLNDSGVYYLRQEPGAEWIRADDPFNLKVYRVHDTATLFERPFITTQTVHDARLTVRAFRRCDVALDGRVIATGSDNLLDWQKVVDVPIPGPVPPGRHLFQIRVTNRNAHPCIWARCDALDLRTGPGWFTVQKDGRWKPAVAATSLRMPAITGQYPTVWEATFALVPWLVLLFAAVFAWTNWNSRRTELVPSRPRWRFTPSRVRWILLAAWAVLAANNIWQAPSPLGYDVLGHLQYVAYVARQRALPLATDGWQMFQPPLFYLLAAPVHASLWPQYGPDTIVMVLRFLPLLCGFAQIEIVYRTARAVFPGKDDLQTLATLVGGLMPMHIYISQVIGNEPLAGCLSAWVVLLCVLLLVEPTRARQHRFFAAMGLVWGLAILSKVTPLLLAPFVAAAVAISCRAAQVRWRTGLARLGLVFGTAFLTSGWFFLRNWIRLGTPIIAPGNWGPTKVHVWWQDPSFRTWEQLTSFGTVLRTPIYGGVLSLWDSLYSTMWLDGNMSGTAVPPEMFPWNIRWMFVGTWLGLVPAGLLLASPTAFWRKELRGSRSPLVFAAAAVAVYLAAIVVLFMRFPIYSTAKATYMLGLLPCFAVLTAAGAAPLMKFRYLRAAIFSGIACWAISTYAAYFSIDYLTGRGMFAP